MKKYLQSFLIAILFVFLGFASIARAIPVSQVGLGGTGTSSPSGILYGTNSTSTALQTLIIGSNLTLSGGTLSASGGGGGSPYPFGLTGNATSSLTQFNGGLTAYASSTIGDGTTGLTISGISNLKGQVNILNNTPIDFGGGTGNDSQWKTGTNGDMLIQTGTNQNLLAREGCDNTSCRFAITNNAFNTDLFSVVGGLGNTTIGDGILTVSTTTATSTFSGGLNVNALNITSSTATSTAANGLNLTKGCFSISGTCLTQNAGTVTSITVSSPLTGGTITNTGSIGCQTASGSQAGCLSSTDWTTFNGKQASGNYITALTGDVSASGAGSVAATLATVNSNVGSFGGVTSIPTFTVNGKGLLTAAGAVTPSIPVGDITGVLPVANGGTASSTALGGILIGNGSGAINSVTIGSGLTLTGTTLTASGGSGTVTSVGLSLPTGFTITNSPVTGSGTLTGTLSSGFSILKLPNWIVAASGGDFTTIQAALNAASSTNGTNGGGTIYLTDSSYSIGSTGQLFKSPNTNIYCRTASTTINFTGATTAFKTSDPAFKFSHDGIHGCTILGDGNVGDVAIDISDMSHSVYEDNTISTAGRAFKASDTQNVTFYNTIQRNDMNAIGVIGIDASSTNPLNGNVIENNFIGCTSNNCIALNMDNANGNRIADNYLEPDGTKTGVIGINIFDNTLSTNNGVFNNEFDTNYIEGGLVSGTVGVKIATSINASGGGIQRNIFTNTTDENNTTDWSVTAASQALNTFIGGYDSNFGNPLTSFQGPVGIGTSTEMQSIGTTPWAFFGINPTAGVAQNAFAIGSSTATLLIINNSGNTTLKSYEASAGTPTLTLDTIGQNFSAGGAEILINHGGSNVVTIQGSLGSGLVNPYLSITRAASAFFATGFGTSTPYAGLSEVSNSTTLPVTAMATTTGKNVFKIDAKGNIYSGGDTPTVTCSPSGGSVAGGNNGGAITTGTLSTSCTLTFADGGFLSGGTMWCTASNSGTVTTNVTSLSNTTVTMGMSALTGTVYYNCGEQMNK